MKITDIRACQPRTPESPDDWRTSLGQILIAVDTDSGLTGYGVGGGGFAGIHVARTVLRDLLIGKDPNHIATLWREMYDGTLAFGQKGLVVMTISGIDLALWDLKGKTEGVPVYDLLGGRQHQRLPTYITVWDNAALSEIVDDGYHGFKLHLESLADLACPVDEFAPAIVEQLCASRQMIGPERVLMADAWMKWNRKQTAAVISRITAEDLTLEWLEEPLPVDDEAGYAELVRSSPLPIAGGEHEYTLAGFRHLIENRLHTVLQPDVCWCGGLTELVRIYELAAQHGIRVCPHRGSEIWSLHAMAALDPQPLAESGRHWMNWVAGQPPIVNGWIEVGDEPGFGIHIDEQSLDPVPTPVYDHWQQP
ncbi:MAG: mandelate racemase/muconate lactonizing enzyme family protein [Planctomycetaceae bacterium]